MTFNRGIWEGKISKIDGAIQELKDEHKRYPGLLLTEEDMRVHLYSRLMNIFNQISQTDDGFSATQVHAEVSWYDESGKLHLTPDITVLEPKALRLLNQIKNDGIPRRLPSKEFVYAGYGTAIIFELKYLRRPTNPKAEEIQRIKYDTEKIERLLNMWNSVSKQTVFAYLVVFSKTQYRSEEVEQIVRMFNQHGSDRKAFYFSGSLDPALF